MGNGVSIPAWTARWIDPSIRVVDLDVTIPDAFKEWRVNQLADASGG